MTRLSVNLNKIALLRNARVEEFTCFRRISATINVGLFYIWVLKLLVVLLVTIIFILFYLHLHYLLC